MKQIKTDVFVVGAGPTGLSAAALLAKYGVDVLAITRYPGTANSPRAHVTNQRCMEVFRDLGIEREVVAAATPNTLMGENVWATSFAGREIARLAAWGTGEDRKGDYEKSSPSEMCNIGQHVMEPIILEAAKEFGAKVMFNALLISMRQDADQVYSICRDEITGEEVEIVSKYAIGGDGDNSVVVKEIGFEMEGQMGLGAAVNCWLEVDLEKYTSHRPGVLYWLAQPGSDYWVGSGTWICVKPYKEWVLLFMYNPEDGQPDLSEAGVIARARTLIGDPHAEIKVKAVSKWTINHVAAKQMRKDRVLIAGNAAHRHPPANGLGTNTCVQDSFNLCWKLAMVLKGQADPSILDSYNDERQPVARQVVDRAMKSVRDMLPISKALGFEPGQSSEDGWASIDELFSDTPRGRERRKELDKAVQLQNYQFNCNGVELGQVYSSKAVIQDGTQRPMPPRDPELYYNPTTFPGSTIPHAWIELDRKKVSTLDVVGHGAFTVVTGIGGQAWKDAAEKLSIELGVPVNAVAIGNGMDALDVYGAWANRREIEEDGCLLVRPDRYIAFRANAMVGNPEQQLRQALQQILGR